MTTFKFLEKKARWVRQEVLEKIFRTGKGHIGGTFSCVEILVAFYFGKLLKIRLGDLNWEGRDRFILSKGHACLALYAIFWDMGIISKALFASYGRDGGLGGQLDINIPGVDFNTGSLGHSVGVGAGMALAAKTNSQKYKVVTIIGDSELFEGSVWEAFVFAGNHRLSNLVVIVDRNRLMVTDVLSDGGLFENFALKVKSFGWEYFGINGHGFNQIFEVFEKIKRTEKPVLVIADTIRGKGVSFIENNLEWYTKVPNRREFELAKKELAR